MPSDKTPQPTDSNLIEVFHDHRNRLIALTKKLHGHPIAQHYSETLQKIMANLEQNRFRLVVLGQFKRGKSTFLNALLSEPILPMDVIPVTAVITEIIFGPQKKAQILFENGKSVEIEVEQLTAFVSEEQNPNNAKKVDKVIVYHSSHFLKEGLILVDTPGVGSIHQHNTRLTREYIPNVDAALFLFSADPPLTELEQNFLKLILPFIPQIFFVLNKKDYLQPASLEKVLQFNRQIIEKLTGQAPTIWPISALNALKAKQQNDQQLLAESGLDQLQTSLQNFLMNHRGRLVILSNCDRLLRLVRQMENFILMEQKAQQLSVENLQQNIEQFKNYSRQMEHRQQNLSYLLDGLKKRLVEMFDTMAENFLKEAQQKILEKMQSQVINNRQLTKADITRKGEQLLNNEIVNQFEPFRLQAEKQIKESYLTEIMQINKEVNEIINDIYKYSAQLLGLTKISSLPQESWRFESQFYYKTWEVVTTLDYLEKGIWMLLPDKFSRLVYHRKVKQWIKEKLDRQCGRLRSDFLYRLQDSNREYLYEFRQTLEKIFKTISELMEKYLKQKKLGEKELELAVQQQKKHLGFLNTIQREIENLKAFWNQAN